ncbi:MAG TPA: amino acid adenylation domain-containing protein, partial [Anaerolineaceae bacterium]|nr:amino acid adenylation domain-containing protein [Anaerolineaceae bacterium]
MDTQRSFSTWGEEIHTIVSLLQMRAATQPEQVIFTFLLDGETIGPSLTYGQLDTQARRIAAQLQAMAAPAERALLLYPPGLDYITGFFGCLYAGVIAVPAYPPDPTHLDQVLPRILAIANDSQATLALTIRPVLEMVAKLKANTPGLEGVQWVATDILPQGQELDWKPVDPKPESLAYLQYTSGSTRMPKGVCLSHANLMHNSRSITHIFELTQEDVIVLWLPMYHNMGLVGGVLQPFYTGASCYLMSPLAFLQQPIRWLQAISRFKGTGAGGPNFGYDLCVQRTKPEQIGNLDLSSWALAFNGAEPIRPETLDRFTAMFAPCGFQRKAFFPCYGLAEATLLVTGSKRGAGPILQNVNRVALGRNQVEAAQAGSRDAHTLISCGKAFRDQDLRIVQPETLVRLPEGQVGEIWISGKSVAQGYWNMAEDTAQTFHGYQVNGEGPFLRTGDLGFLQDGECFITGRLKDLIIIRGRNHYPQDIEDTVQRLHPALIPNGGAAFSVDISGEERLVIVQELNPVQALDFSEITRHIRRVVADTHELQVHSLVLVEPQSTPKTQSGKVQRQACKKLYLSGSLKILHTSTIEIEPPPAAPSAARQEPPAKKESLLQSALMALGKEKGQTLLETYLQGKICEILRVAPSQVDPAQPLTALGLDSIMTVELAEEVETTLGVPLQISDLLQGASLSDLVRNILKQLFKEPSPQMASPGKATEPQPLPPQKEETEESPLTYGQRALWFIQKLLPENVAHNIVYAVRMPANIQLPKLRHAFAQIVQRHAILRTTFLEIDGKPIQIVHPKGDFEYTLEDTAGWTDAEIDARLSADINRPFDLEKGPLMRVVLLRSRSAEIILLLAFHHIVIDMWSMAIFIQELGQFYTAEVRGQPVAVRPIEAKYTDHVRWEAEMVSGPEGEAHWAYWKQRLSGDLLPVNLPTDNPRPEIQTGRGGALTMRLGIDTTQKLKGFAEKYQTNLFNLLFTAFNVLLYRYTDQTDLLIGSPKANRQRRNATIFGYFINPVVLRTDVSGDPTFAELLERVKRNVAADFEHDAYPFPLLVEKLQPSRAIDRGPLFQIFFSWQKTTRLVGRDNLSAFALGDKEGHIELGDLVMDIFPLRDRVTPTDLALLVAEMGEDLAMTVEYSTDLFQASTIERMMDHFRLLLESVILDPNQPIANVAFLSAAERKLLLEDWTPAPSFRPEDYRLVHEQIEAITRQNPDAPAVTFAGQTWTYAELNQRAEALAVILQQAGVGPNVTAGVFMERSLEVVASLLGILKAGGTYLPLDPDYPVERLEFMLSDSQAPILLTQAALAGQLHLGGDIRQICLDQEWDAIVAAAGGAIPENKVRPEDAAYVMYTSGSTGQPKGVVIPHRSIALHSIYMVRYYQLSPADRVLQFASANFDPSLEQIFTTLISGGQLIIRDVELWDPAIFSQKCAELGLTEVNIHPAYWQQWVKAEIQNPDPVRNPQLRLVIIGGDVFQTEVLKQWQKLPLSSARLINAYGPTELTVTAAAYDVPRTHQPALRTQVPIGRPLGGRRAYVLNSSLQMVPLGVSGELYFGGECLAKGYLNQPELTAEKFIQDPYNLQKNARMYR